MVNKNQLIFLKNKFMKKIITLITLFVFITLNAQNTSSQPTGNSSEVGIIEGNLNVSLTGGANYNIPLILPPGINSVEPNISLGYNSQSGNGIAGYGWNINGISTINRIASTTYHDGIMDGVDFDNLDRYAFDGQRLIVKSGTAALYGKDNTVYETENYSNAKITSFGTHHLGANYGPSYFSVNYPDGSIAMYGLTNDSRSSTEWSISYSQNPQGVRINYHYISTNNILSITKITYGSLLNNTPINEINFLYKNRFRNEQAYIGGVNFNKNNILNTIQIKGNNVGFKNYDLSYDQSSLGYERLIKVTEKTGDNTKSLNPTVFSYESTDNSLSYNLFGSSFLNIGSLAYTNTTAVSGDFNGDNKVDVILKNNNSTTSFLLYNGLSTNTYNTGLTHTYVAPIDDIFTSSSLKRFNTEYKLVPHDTYTVVTGNGSTFTTYLNDGNNIIQLDQKEISYGLYTINECVPVIIQGVPTILPLQKQKHSVKKIINGDFNGDGLSDVLSIENGFLVSANTCIPGSYTNIFTFNAFFIDLDPRKLPTATLLNPIIQAITPNTNIQVIDFNGDGKSDLMMIDNGLTTVYSFNETNSEFIILYRSGIDYDLINKNNPTYIGDYNGDGKTDFITPFKFGINNYVKYTSTGNIFLKEYVTYTLPNHANNSNNTFYIIPSDMNNDGKTDLIHVKNYKGDNGFISVDVYKNINNTFEKDIFATSGLQPDILLNPIPIIISPLKNNANLEIGFISNNKVHRFQANKDFSKDKLINKITTGNGVVETITYKSLVDLQDINENINLYTSTTYTENYPNLDIKFSNSFKVVSKLEMYSQTTYKKQLFGYHGAVSNTDGLGFLGFRSLCRTNWHNNNFLPIYNVTKHDITKRGAMIESYSYLNASLNFNQTPLSFINKTISNYTSTLFANKVFKIWNTSAISYNGLDNTSKESTTLYDIYNNPKTYTTITKLGGTVEQTESVILDYDFPTTTPYIIGRPKQKNTSVTHGSDTTTGEEIYGYNSNNLLSQIKKKGHGTNYIVEDNEYDLFGNIIKKTISAAPILPRVTNYQYDVSGRFIINSTDIENLNTQYENNSVTGLLINETNPYGLKTHYLYDGWGKKIKTTDYLGKSVYYAYTIPEPKFSLITSTTDEGSTSMSKFDDLGREILEGVKNVDGQWSYARKDYDEYNRKSKVFEPHHFQNATTLFTAYTYDVYGRLIKTVEPSAKVTDITYSGLTSIVSDGFKTISTTNNSLGKPVSVTDNGGTIIYTYYASGNLKNSNFEGTVISMEYDGWGRKLKMTDPSAGTYQYEYNPLGELTKEIKPNPKGEINYTLDNFGKIDEKIVTSADGLSNSKTKYNYDATSKLAASTRFNDYIENTVTDYEYTYDGYKRIIKTTEKNSATANFEHEINYDAFGRTHKERFYAINNANAKVSQKWIKHTYKNGFNWQILDDASSQILWQTNIVTARGQLSYATLGNGITIANTYDQLGFPTEFKHDGIQNFEPVNIMTLGMNFEPKRENLLSRTNSMFGITQTTTEDTPEGPVTTTVNIPLLEKFKYDALNRLTEWGAAPELLLNIDFLRIKPDPFAEFPAIDPLSLYQFLPVNGATISNALSKLNIVTTAAFSGTERLVLVNATLGTKLRLNVAVNKNNTDKIRVVAIEKDTITLVETQYELGLANEGVFEAIHVVVNNNVNVCFRFDKSPLSTDAGVQTNFRLDNFVVEKISGETQDYDNKGRITQNRLGTYNYNFTTKKYQNSSIFTTVEANNYYSTRQLQTVTYNAFKGPVQITEDTVDKVSFTYNTLDNRAAMYYGGLQTDKLERTHRKFYSADGAMEIKYNKDSGVTELLMYIGGDAYTAPVLLKSDGITQEYLYLHRDYQGSIMAITNQNAQVIEKRHYDAWGSVTAIHDINGIVLTHLVALDRGYTGHEHLQSVKLIHMNGRLYDPMLHRFLQPDNFVQDPTNTQNYNRYGYVMNNPLLYVDYSGESYDCLGCQDNSNWSTTGDLSDVDPNALKKISRDISDFMNSLKVGRFLDNNLKSIGNFFGDIFGSKNRNAPATPSFSGHRATSGWQNEGFNSSGISGSQILDGFQTGLDVVGLVPGLGEIADGANALIYLGKGDYTNASLSGAAMIPFAGWAATGTKLAIKAEKAYSVAKVAKGGVNVVKQVAVHGNSLKSLKPTWGYKLYSQDGTFLKNGITNKIIPQSRYTRAFMKGKYMEPVQQFPNRLKAYQWEYQQNIIQRGPLNLNMH